MKGLILSGGYEMRLRTKQKQLIPAINSPLPFYVMGDIIETGVNEIAIIVGRNKRHIEEAMNVWAI